MKSNGFRLGENACVRSSPILFDMIARMGGCSRSGNVRVVGAGFESRPEASAYEPTKDDFERKEIHR